MENLIKFYELNYNLSTTNEPISSFAPLTLTINPSAIPDETNDIVQLRYDFGDGTTYIENRHFNENNEDPRNYSVVHLYQLEKNVDQKSFNLTLDVIEAHAFESSQYSLNITLLSPPLIDTDEHKGLFEDIHLIKNRKWGENNNLLVFETRNPHYNTNVLIQPDK